MRSKPDYIVSTLFSAVLISPIYLSLGLGSTGVTVVYLFAIFQTVIIVLINRYIFNSPETLGKLFILIVVFQNVGIGLALHLNKEIDLNSVRILISYSSMYALIVVLTVVFLNGRKTMRIGSSLSNYEYAALLFIGTVVVYFFIGSAPIFAKLGYLRNFTICFILYLLGLLSWSDKSSTRNYIMYIFILGVIVSLLGLIERFFLPTDFWAGALNMSIIAEAKGWDIGDGAMPGVFNTDFFGIRAQRLSSTFGEPVNAAYFFAFCSLAGLLVRNNAVLFICGISLLATIGKGGILTFIVGSSVILYGQHIFRKRISLSKVALLIPVIIAAIIIYLKMFAGATMPHIWGLAALPENLISNPLGSGLGMGGNWGKIFNGVASTDFYNTGAESLLSVIGHQLGIVGLLFYGGFFVLTVRHFLTRRGFSLKRGNVSLSNYNLFVAASMLGMFLASFFQENTLGPQAGGVFFLFMGIVERENIDFAEMT